MPHRRVRVAPAAAGAAVANFVYGHCPYVGHILQAREELPGRRVGVEFRGHVCTLSGNKKTSQALGNPPPAISDVADAITRASRLSVMRPNPLAFNSTWGLPGATQCRSHVIIMLREIWLLSSELLGKPPSTPPGVAGTITRSLRFSVMRPNPLTV